MDKLLRNRREIEAAFLRSIEPINLNFKLRPPELVVSSNKKHYDGLTTIFEYIGSKEVCLALAREGAQYIKREIEEAQDLSQQIYLRAIPYKNSFIIWCMKAFNYLHHFFNDYLPEQYRLAITDKNMEPIDDVNDDQSLYYREDEDRFTDFETDSIFSNADTEMTSPRSRCGHRKSPDSTKVAELENEIELLKRQLALVLNKMNISVPATQESSSVPLTSAPPPPPPPPSVDFLKSGGIAPILRQKESEPKAPSVSNAPPSAPRISEILGDLSAVKLRHVPRSPGGTPCRAKVSESDSMAEAVKNAMKKRRANFDSSFEGNLKLNESSDWEDNVQL